MIPMTQSMTAFARQTAEHAWGSLAWEIRSVNHRYLEPTFKLPESLRQIEGELREKLRTRVARGKIECSLRVQRATGDDTRLNIDEAMLVQVLQCTAQVSQKLIDPEQPNTLALLQTAPINPLEILSWPGVLKTVDDDEEQTARAALGLFEQTLEQLVAHRAREGAELGQYIAAQLDAVAAIVKTVREHMPALIAAQRQKLRDRLAELSADLNNDRIEQEMVMLAQKSDVEEELDRLQTHIKEVHRALKQKEPCGRRLDFLMQEFNREANTLSSKSLASDTTLNAVQLKVLIEQMREQIQNIE
jgi:uncharacterized protein (TIGR00255 family)